MRIYSSAIAESSCTPARFFTLIAVPDGGGVTPRASALAVMDGAREEPAVDVPEARDASDPCAGRAIAIIIGGGGGGGAPPERAAGAAADEFPFRTIIGGGGGGGGGAACPAEDGAAPAALIDWVRAGGAACVGSRAGG